MLPLHTEPLDESPELKAFARFAELTATKKELNAQLLEIEPQLRALEPILLGYLGQTGYDSVKVGGFTMSPVRVPWVYPVTGITRQTVCEALKISGLGRFVKEGFNTRSLTAYVRELETAHELVSGTDPEALKQLLPAALAEVLEVKPSFRLQVLDRRDPQQKRNASHETIKTTAAETEEEESGNWND